MYISKYRLYAIKIEINHSVQGKLFRLSLQLHAVLISYYNYIFFVIFRTIHCSQGSKCPSFLY